jgi:hypothetical protein
MEFSQAQINKGAENLEVFRSAVKQLVTQVPSIMKAASTKFNDVAESIEARSKLGSLIDRSLTGSDGDSADRIGLLCLLSEAIIKLAELEGERS